MKRILFLSAILLTCHAIQAQDYAPFLLGKTHRFLTVSKKSHPAFNDPDSAVARVKIDHIDVKDKDSIFYCFNDYKTGRLINYRYKILFDFCNYVKNDSSISFFNRDNKLVYRINNFAKIGDTLMINADRYSVFKEKKEQTFLGITDSVKVFEVRSKDQHNYLIGNVILSKKHGMINIIVEGYAGAALFSIKELNLGRSPIDYN